MQPVKFSFKAALLIMLLQGIHALTFSQHISWMKGMWNEYSSTPHLHPPVKCANTLQITAVADSTFTGIQTTYFDADTTTKVAYNCKGLLTHDDMQFYRGDLIYKRNSSQTNYEWNDCSKCDISACKLYVDNNKMILLLTISNCDSACNGTVAYYRDLNGFDATTQKHLLSLYQTPQYSTGLVSYTETNSHQTNDGTTIQKKPLTTDTSSNSMALPAILKERANKLAQTLQITSPNIEVVLLDDAEIDGDIVSLYHNNKEVIDHKTLGKEVIRYSFKADQQHAYHEIVLVAENLGSIPPNTALMRIRAGDKKYELTTRANMHENAKVIIEYTGN